jgi:NADH dehydrogenase FAD-containing subunit
VEMAGTLAEMSRMALTHDFRHIDPRAAQILLYEAESRVLPAYPEALSAKAQRHLQGLGVKVHTSTRVTLVDGQGIVAGRPTGLREHRALECRGAGIACRTLARRGHGQIRASHRQFRFVDTWSPGGVCYRRYSSRCRPGAESAWH